MLFYGENKKLALVNITEAVRCDGCNENIPSRIIHVRVYKSPTDYKDSHLHCFQPKLNHYISLNDFRSNISGTDKVMLQPWIVEGNSKFPPLYSIKHVPSTPPTNRRTGIEILKFIPPFEIHQTMTLVSKGLYHVAGDEEIWKFHCVNQFKIKEIVPNGRNHYIKLAPYVCAGCNYINTWDHPYRCPIIKKYLCDTCRKSDSKYMLMNKTAITRMYDVNANLLNLRFNKGAREVYKFEVDEALVTFRNMNKDKLLHDGQNRSCYDGLKALLDSINVEDNLDRITPNAELLGRVHLSTEGFKKLCYFISTGKGMKSVVYQIY